MDPTSADEYDAQIASDNESVGEDGLKQENHSPNSAANGAKSSAHLQKRRRVTRACDECRRKKIKCDGKQPCTHCTVYSYDCTYDQPSNRRRNPAPQYVESLEHRVHRAETLLHILIPNLDLTDPGIDAAVAQGWIPGAPGKGNPTTTGPKSSTMPTSNPIPDAQSIKNKPDINLESMVRAVSQLDLDEQGHWDYHGHSSGLSFVRRMREQLGDLMGPETVATPFTKSRPNSHVLDSPHSISDSPGRDASPQNPSDLPPKDLAVQFCQHALNDAAALMQFVHKPSFWVSFESLYSTPAEHYTNEHSQFLPLFYSALALGHLFGKDENSSLNQQGYENSIQRGFRYFKTARQMMDIADCRDLPSIQAVLFMILFLQSSAKLSQCYAYLGVALRSALRMGLHRAHAGKFDPIEAEMRKKVFWSIRKLDIYVGAMIGLPQTLSDDDIDQEFPTEVDDEYVTHEGIKSMPAGQVSVVTAFNCHTRLVQVLAKIVRKIYPIKMQEESLDKSYTVPFSTIREIESDLEEWKNNLPPILSPCPAPVRYTRIQQLLRLSYAHAQVMLYRPFLHFTAMEKRTKPIDQRAYACAASYVNVSRNIVHITVQMKQKGLLNGPFWFTAYTTFFSILSLVYFAAENPDNPTTHAVMKDALEGKQVLAALSTRSMAADRCTATLTHVFQRLPDWMREGRQNPGMVNKKRQFDDSSSDGHQLQVQASRSHPDVAAVARESIGGPGMVKRASTFPQQRPDTPNGDGGPMAFPPSWRSSVSSYGPHTPTSAGFDGNSFSQFNQPGTPNAMSSGMQPFSGMPSSGYPSLHDLSALSFPTADEPFLYPNQPLTTFENNLGLKSNPGNRQSVHAPTINSIENNSAAGSMIGTPTGEDNLEAQFFALPPYMEQRQHQQRAAPFPLGSHMNFQPGQNQQPPTSAPNNVHGNMQNGSPWPNQQPNMAQQDYSNINIQEIFGGNEWNPMMMNPAGDYQGL